MPAASHKRAGGGRAPGAAVQRAGGLVAVRKVRSFLLPSFAMTFVAVGVSVVAYYRKRLSLFSLRVTITVGRTLDPCIYQGGVQLLGVKRVLLFLTS